MRRILREVLLLCAVALLPAAITGYRELKYRPERPLAEGEVRLSDAWAWGENAIWVDARPISKYQRRHIPTAIALNPEEWDSQVVKFLDEWEPDKRTIVYAGRDSDAAQTIALRLKTELNIPEVWTLHGGFEAWELQ